MGWHNPSVSQFTLANALYGEAKKPLPILGPTNFSKKLVLPFQIIGTHYSNQYYVAGNMEVKHYNVHKMSGVYTIEQNNVTGLGLS